MAVLVPAGFLEVIFRDALAWRAVALILGVAPVFTLLWRRTNPLVMLAVAWGAQTVAEAAPLFGAAEPAILYTSAYALLLPYSLFRWGAGREAAIGLVIILVSHLFTASVNSTVPRRSSRSRSSCSLPRSALPFATGPTHGSGRWIRSSFSSASN